MQVQRLPLRLTVLLIISSCILVAFSVLWSPNTYAAIKRSHEPAKGHLQILPKKLNLQPDVNTPAYTTSLYENTTDIGTVYNQGCNAAHRPAGLIVVDWGKPVDLGNGVYGTYDFGRAEVTDDDILHAMANFAQGVWDCRTSSTNIALAIGESNYYNNGLPLTISEWYTDGQAWGNMVNSVQSFIANNGYSNVVGAYGAGDLETEWARFDYTSNLVNGYNNTSSREYFDFGDATPGYYTNFQLWYIAYGALDNWPLPEIYYNADATNDWEPLSIWACTNEGSPIYFKGTMAESAGDNTPNQAYTDMYNAEASNSCTAQSLSGLIFSTNI